MYALCDTFNRRIISRHLSLEAAAKGKREFNRRFRRNNSRHSYISTTIMEVRDGKLAPLDDQEQDYFYELCDGELHD